MRQLYCSRYLNNAYHFYWRSMGLCYANPQFSQPPMILRAKTSLYLKSTQRAIFRTTTTCYLDSAPPK